MISRRLLWVVVLSWAAVTSTWAQSVATGLFAEGNELYRMGDYAGALRTYHQIAVTGVQDARLFYNMGNAHFKSDHLGEAVVWYERALQLHPRDADILANLRFARHVKTDREPPREENALTRAATSVYGFLTLNEISVCFSLCIFVVWILASLHRLRPSGGFQKPTFVVVVSLTVFTSALFGARIYDREFENFAIVMTEQATARSGPDKNQTPVFVLHEGTKVHIDRAEGTWYLVRLPNGSGGWMPQAVVTPI